MSELLKISIADEPLRAALGRVIATLHDTTPLMRALSEIMVDASARAFEQTADPVTGAPWKPLSASRQRQRAKKGRSIANMLQDSGLLVGSIARPWGPSGTSARTMPLSEPMFPMPPRTSSGPPSNAKPPP